MLIFTFPHRSMISLAHQGERIGLATYSFQRICKAFLALHLAQQQQRLRLCETCPMGDLVKVVKSQHSFRHSISKVEHLNKLWNLVYYKMKYVPLN